MSETGEDPEHLLDQATLRDWERTGVHPELRASADEAAHHATEQQYQGPLVGRHEVNVHVRMELHLDAVAAEAARHAAEQQSLARTEQVLSRMDQVLARMEQDQASREQELLAEAAVRAADQQYQEHLGWLIEQQNQEWIRRQQVAPEADAANEEDDQERINRQMFAPEAEEAHHAVEQQDQLDLVVHIFLEMEAAIVHPMMAGLLLLISLWLSSILAWILFD